MKFTIIAAAFILASGAVAAPTVAVCGAGNTNEFVVTDLLFSGHARYSTPAHLATSEAKVSFKLKLPTKPRLLVCSATTTGTYPRYFDGKKDYRCVDGQTTSASFRYNSDTQSLFINSKWSCPDLGSAFKASGRGKVTEQASCKTRSVKNPNWSLENTGQYEDIYTKCKDAESTITIGKISGVQ